MQSRFRWSYSGGPGYAPDALGVGDLDGYSFEFSESRFNIRTLITEPVVRLNVESRDDED